jgi:hypothetical protein
MQRNERLSQELQVAQQTIKKLETENGTLVGEKRQVELSVKAVRSLMEQLKEQYLQEQVRALSLEDIINIVKTSADAERTSLLTEISKLNKEVSAAKDQATIHVGQILKKTQAIAYTESLARNIFNIMFGLLGETKTTKKIKEYVDGSLGLKEFVLLAIQNTGLTVDYDGDMCDALRKHVTREALRNQTSEPSNTEKDVQRVTALYQAMWLLSKVVCDTTESNTN